jgi:hypothetical protein
MGLRVEYSLDTISIPLVVYIATNPYYQGYEKTGRAATIAYNPG